jgi:hypothetical protein
LSVETSKAKFRQWPIPPHLPARAVTPVTCLLLKGLSRNISRYKAVTKRSGPVTGRELSVAGRESEKWGQKYKIKNDAGTLEAAKSRYKPATGGKLRVDPPSARSASSFAVEPMEDWPEDR